MRLLLAIDSITTLNVLLDEVTARSWPKGTKARVLSVVENEEGGLAAVRHEMRRREEQITALAVERLRAIGIATEVTIRRGNPKQEIPFAAREWATDLIFVRAYGSVTKSVIESVSCSVEVVRDAEAGGDFKILLATDGSGASLTASQVVAQPNWPEFTQVKIVSVVNPLTYSLEEIGVWSDKATDRAHRAIGQAVQVVKNTRLKITGEVIADRTARGIVDRARKWGADLIVLGTHDRRGLKRFLLGSISAAVAKRAHCSVRVVRARGFPKDQYKTFALRRAA